MRKVAMLLECMSRESCIAVLAMMTTCLVVWPLSAQQNISQGSKPEWVGTWAAAPTQVEGAGSALPLSGVTMREIIHISTGGKEIRIRFTNEFGLDPLIISDVHVALSKGKSQIQPATDHPVTFGDATTVRIPPGGVIFSAPVPLSVTPFSNVTVSFYLPSQIMRSETYHRLADQDNYLADGDVADAESLPSATVLTSWYFLDGIDVPVVDGSGAIVALGDSITDGGHSTLNANHRWPDFLAKRLGNTPGFEHISVLNEGIGGNRILNDGYGPNVLARLDRDVLAQNGVRCVIVLEGINDIGRLARPQNSIDSVSVQQLEMGFDEIVSVAHEHGIKVIGATLTPYGGAAYYSVKGERIREALNDWIRGSGVFDGIADFDRVIRDPANPNRVNPQYDFGDHLHPNDDGYRAMADAIDLSHLNP